jgi:hypothetical protein
MIKMVYYSTTTLTTIGLGDLHPKSDIERAVCTFIMLFGVMLFTYITSMLIVIIMNLMDYTKEFDEHLRLTQFLEVVSKFNHKG